MGKILSSAASVSSTKWKLWHLANENAQRAFKEVGLRENAQEFIALPLTLAKSNNARDDDSDQRQHFSIGEDILYQRSPLDVGTVNEG